MDSKMAVHLPAGGNDKKNVASDKHIAVHGVITSEDWTRVHNSYVSKGLVY